MSQVYYFIYIYMRHDKCHGILSTSFLYVIHIERKSIIIKISYKLIYFQIEKIVYVLYVHLKIYVK